MFSISFFSLVLFSSEMGCQINEVQLYTAGADLNHKLGQKKKDKESPKHSRFHYNTTSGSYRNSQILVPFVLDRQVIPNGWIREPCLFLMARSASLVPQWRFPTLPRLLLVDGIFHFGSRFPFSVFLPLFASTSYKTWWLCWNKVSCFQDSLCPPTYLLKFPGFCRGCSHQLVCTI